MTRCLSGVLAAALCVALARADNWPAWRGPGGQGHAAETRLPLTWGPKENVRWRVPLPDSGNSTPAVWGDRVFVTQAADKTQWPPKNNAGPATAEKRSLICLSRADGAERWRATVAYPEPESTHVTSPFCSASPATDGERVYVSHGSAGLFCYDFAGKELWRFDTGKQEHIWGNASSPVLYQSLCILWIGPGENQALVAVDKASGRERWRHTEPGGASGTGGNRTWKGTWGTPVVARVGDRDELLLGLPGKLKAFDPQTGKELWWCDGLGPLVYTSPVVGKDGVVVAMSGYGGPALAVRAGGSGDVTPKRLWHHTKSNPQRIGSGAIVGDHLYVLNDTGVAQCLEVTTGKEVWSEKLGSTWGSVLAAGDRLYVPTKNSTTFVLKAAPAFEQLARNQLAAEQMFASLAVSDGDVFIRTYKALWCIGDRK